MRKPGFWAAYLLLLLAQLLLSNYCNVSPYVMVTILPVMVMCISIRIGPVPAMVIAFASGLVVDLLSEGLLGLNALALVPVALLRYPIIRLLFGEELFARGEDFCTKRNGLGKTSVVVFMATAVFVLIYVWVDGAGTRPFWFNAARWAASMATSMLLSLACLPNLAPDTRK
jgi:hypothetical protein